MQMLWCLRGTGQHLLPLKAEHCRRLISGGGGERRLVLGCSLRVSALYFGCRPTARRRCWLRGISSVELWSPTSQGPPPFAFQQVAGSRKRQRAIADREECPTVLPERGGEEGSSHTSEVCSFSAP